MWCQDIGQKNLFRNYQVYFGPFLDGKSYDKITMGSPYIFDDSNRFTHMPKMGDGGGGEGKGGGGGLFAVN